MCISTLFDIYTDIKLSLKFRSLLTRSNIFLRVLYVYNFRFVSTSIVIERKLSLRIKVNFVKSSSSVLKLALK